MLPHLLAAILALFSLSFVGGAPQGQGIIIRPVPRLHAPLAMTPKERWFELLHNFDFTNCNVNLAIRLCGYIEVISFYADNPTSELHVFGNEPQHRSPGGYLCSPKTPDLLVLDAPLLIETIRPNQNHAIIQSVEDRARVYRLLPQFDHTTS
ncbi:hypothetical protein PSHT_16331 [Puccinia striiformis]|uniref:Uncharacterized protein n=1 Tax=Puccinia striiformis TaxID=27350 RepID=A0A2S4UAG7_9BASI|nr:hypothetical protein PSHT_16331 [Puccinia striiformis]